jgi:hypothetical protein
MSRQMMSILIHTLSLLISKMISIVTYKSSNKIDSQKMELTQQKLVDTLQN